MSYSQAKVYSDGSHYIAIPQENFPRKKWRKPKPKPQESGTKDGTETPKETFERLYKENAGKRKSEKKEKLIEGMKEHFKDEKTAKQFVEQSLARKKRNEIERRVRLYRKLNLQEWNYFCTFTYADGKHTEESFRKKLSTCLNHFANRKGWKYIGVWERSPEKKRLHFHGIFYIPSNTMVGEVVEVTDYSTKDHRMQTTTQNTFFNEKFGRSDFSEIPHKSLLWNAASYLIKYIEKSGEKLVYSRGLPTYIITDILEDDILCNTGVDDRKLLLYDNFNCIVDGEVIGTASPEVIAQMPKSN